MSYGKCKGWVDFEDGMVPEALTKKEYEEAFEEAKIELFEKYKGIIDGNTTIININVEDFKFDKHDTFKVLIIVKLKTLEKEWFFGYNFYIYTFNSKILIKHAMVNDLKFCIKESANNLLKDVNKGELKDCTVDIYKSLTVIADCHNVYKDKISDREIELFIESRKYIKDEYFKELLLSFNNCYRLPNEAGITNDNCDTNKGMVRKVKITAEIMRRLTQEERDIIDLNYLY